MERNCLSLKKTQQKIKTLFKAADGLSSENITSLAYSCDGTLFAGTAAGLCFFKDGKFCAIKGIESAVISIFACDCGKLFALSESTVYTIINFKITDKQNFTEPVADICRDGNGTIFLLGDSNVYKYTGEKFVFFKDMEFSGARAITAIGNAEIYVACPKALLLLHGKRPSWASLIPELAEIPTSDICSLASDSLGNVWCASTKGTLIFDGKSTWLTPEKSTALPAAATTKIMFGSDGARYIGTEIGLYVTKGTHRSFLGADRWLASPRVTAIAVCECGKEYWVGTENGLSRIELRVMSLEEKAEHYQLITDTFHNREDYINNLNNLVDYDLSTGSPEISDNDGLWTAVYVASQSFRYAVTGDKQAADKARISMKALLKLQRITGVEGFTARAYRRPGEDGYGNGDIEWHAAKDENGDIEWKGETSSDEMVGHYYAAAWYYDLIATDAEKEDIAKSISKITDHMLSHQYTLCDADGLPTTWATWGPFELNSDSKWFWERGINSLEILSFLKTTYHMTGNEKYNDEYMKLIKKHHYALNTVTYKIDDNHSCHIDDKLGFMTIHTLMTYEKDPEILKYYQMGIGYHYDVERIERCPTWSFIYGGLTDEPCDIEAAVRTLQEMPLDLIGYNMNNSCRPDVEIDHSPKDFGGEAQAKIPLPADERPAGKLAYNAFELDYTREHISAACPSTWLFPYWIGRYYKLFCEE